MMRSKSDREGGFSLVELMVVILVVAILLAIALPTFLGSRARSQNRSAQARARNAYLVQQIYNADVADDADEPSFTEDIVELRRIEPQLTFFVLAEDDGVPTDDESAFVDVMDGPDADEDPGDIVLVSTKSKTGRCYWIKTFPSPGLPRFAENDCEEEGRPPDAEYTSRWGTS